MKEAKTSVIKYLRYSKYRLRQFGFF